MKPTIQNEDWLSILQATNKKTDTNAKTPDILPKGGNIILAAIRRSTAQSEEWDNWEEWDDWPESW